MKKTKENKGITLIALIITIIVMLILVGVSVNVALNGGLFDTAKTASEKTNEAVEAEKEFGAYVALIARTDEFVKDYPLNVIIEGEKIRLQDNNIVLLYKEILQEYGIEPESLTMSQAIKTSHVFYEIYDEEIKTHEEELVRNDFWSIFLSPMSDNNAMAFSDLSQEDQKMYVALAFACVFGIDDTGLLTSNIDNVKYNILIEPIEFFGVLEDAGVLDDLYPGGSFPVHEITGIAESNFSIFESMDGLGKICIMTEEIANSNLLFIDGNNSVLDPEDYIGHTICLITKQEAGESLVADVDYAGTPLKNVMLINTQTGDLIYVDDDGQPSKPLS